MRFALRQIRSTNTLSNHATIRGDAKRSPTIEAPGLIVALGIGQAPVAQSTEWPLVVVPVASSFECPQRPLKCLKYILPDTRVFECLKEPFNDAVLRERSGM